MMRPVVFCAVHQARLGPEGPVEAWTVIDIALWAVPLGIVAARFYHVFTHVSDYFHPGANLWNVFAIWDGGNAIYGSLIGGAIGAYIGCRRAGLRFWAFADALAPALLVAQAIGRLGNYFNQELFRSTTTLPWGLEILPTAPMFPAGTLFHPLFLYEMMWNLIGASVIVLLKRRLTLGWGAEPRDLPDLVRHRSHWTRSDPHRPHQRRTPGNPRQHLGIYRRRPHRHRPPHHSNSPTPLRRASPYAKVSIPAIHEMEPAPSRDMNVSSPSR